MEQHNRTQPEASEVVAQLRLAHETHRYRHNTEGYEGDKAQEHDGNDGGGGDGDDNDDSEQKPHEWVRAQDSEWEHGRENPADAEDKHAAHQAAAEEKGSESWAIASAEEAVARGPTAAVVDRDEERAEQAQTQEPAR